jgi:two-component system cell cycle response regulator
MRHRILVVDDSRTVRSIVKRAFKPFDCVTREAATGAEGLELAATETPHLILLDLTMPAMDGPAVLARLKGDRVLQGVPVIILTPENGREAVRRIPGNDVWDYLVKPFTEALLIEKVRSVLPLRPPPADVAVRAPQAAPS